MRSSFLAFLLLASGAGALAQTTQAPPPQAATDYVIGSQDVLMISVYDQEDLNGKFQVDADGTFTFPLIGRVKAGGLTLRQLEATLKKQLKDGAIFKDP